MTIPLPRSGALLALCVLAVTHSVPAEAAPDPAAGAPIPSWETSPDSSLAVALRRIEGTPLSLEEALRVSMENATAAVDAEARLRVAAASYRIERGAFDPELFASWERNSSDAPTASFFSGADTLKSDVTRSTGGVRMRLPIGTELSASIDLTENESNSAFASLSPEYNAGGVLSLRQPLLSGFGPAASAPLTAARREMEAGQARYRDAIAVLRSEVEVTYWDLHASEQDLAVAIAIRDMADALLQEAKYRSAAGLVGPNQVANARVFLAEQEQALLDREERLDLVSDHLATLMGRRPEGRRFRAQSEPPRDFGNETEDAIVGRVLAGSPELSAAELQLKASEARLRGARWDALPALDLHASLGGTGLSGEPRDVVFGGDTLRTAISGGGSGAVSDAIKRDFPNWSVGVTLTLPLGLRSERAERERAEAEHRLAESAYLATRRSLEERARAAARELLHGTRRLGAAREGVDASLEQIRIGRIEYRNGRTTAFELVRLGADLASAQQRLSAALVRTARAVAEIRRLTGEASPSESLRP